MSAKKGFEIVCMRERENKTFIVCVCVRDKNRKRETKVLDKTDRTGREAVKDNIKKNRADENEE